MTKDDIIKMAREVGMYYREIEDEFHTSYSDGVCFEELERFAELVVAQERKEFAIHAIDISRRAIAEEREACAKLADKYMERWTADAIRARG